MAIVANVGRIAVDAEVPTTNGTNAYGEVVWSRRLGAGVKSVGQVPPATVARKPITGESTL